MQRNLIRSIALLFLMKDGKICLGKRQNTGSMDGCWALPAGHVEAGESAMQGMIREAKEETGIDIDPADLTCALVSYRRTQGIQGEAVDFFFSCKQWQGDVVNAEPDKCEGWAFLILMICRRRWFRLKWQQSRRGAPENGIRNSDFNDIFKKKRGSLKKVLAFDFKI